jgi:uncharacterized protein (TIGR02391 family)
MAVIPLLDNMALQAACDVLADTGSGLTGSEIGRYLNECGIVDPHPGITKRHRLYEALRGQQEKDGCANCVFRFIQTVLRPVLYVDKPQEHGQRLAKVNSVLVFAGYRVLDTGDIQRVSAARTLSEAEQRAGRMQNELRRRQVHADVLTFCRAELLQDNYFHAVLEATKSLSEKIRQKTGLSGDGGELASAALGLGQAGLPYLAFNRLQTDTEKCEQKGLTNIFVGVFGAFRNVTAHGPKIAWNMTEQDALDLLTIVSLLHRRLDVAVSTGRSP